MTHRSFLNENSKRINPHAKVNKILSNERLEFLGDSILSYIVSTLLYKEFPNFEEGELTNLRSTLVKTSTLAGVAKNLEIGNMLKLSKGEIMSRGQENQSILADAFEAIIGALFIDQGLEAVEKLLKEVLIPLIPGILRKGSLKDYKSLLQEIIQERYKTSPNYQVAGESGPDHAKTFRIIVSLNNKQVGTGTGSSKQGAEQKAAQDALEYLQKNLVE